MLDSYSLSLEGEEAAGAVAASGAAGGAWIVMLTSSWDGKMASSPLCVLLGAIMIGAQKSC